MSQQYEICHAQSFPLELGRAPKKVRNAYLKVVVPTLQSVPDKADPPRIKRLNGYKALWRLRVSDDYRLVYHVDQENRIVTMLMLDHRAKVYERLGANESGEPGVRIIVHAEELLEREPTPEETGQASIIIASQPPDPAPAPDKPLPEPLNPEILTQWGVPEEYHYLFIQATTEGALLELGKSVPKDILERVLNAIWPPKIEEIIQQPVRSALEPAAVESAASGERSLESFLLKLDDEQKTFVDRFSGGRPRGPWLLKGGPGSGKSTVALHCVQSLVRGAEEQLPLDDKPLRILFTTFTNSLTNASRHLLEALSVNNSKHQVDIRTVDSLALSHLPKRWKALKCEARQDKYLVSALKECIEINPKFGFSNADINFLIREIDWVVVGQGLSSSEEYLQAERTGRGRALTQMQRQQVWQLFELFRKRMREAGQCLFSERLHEAARNVTPEYDYVFIDEAQDLRPIAIRFCIGLCRNPNSVFLTADTNQSIYSNGMSWTKVASDLRFQGRARILRRNYRTTTEIWQGVAQLAPSSDDADRDTLNADTIYRGPFPILARYTSAKKLRERLNTFLHESLRLERVAPGCAAVLCPTNTEMKKMVNLLDPRFNAKAMSSSEVDLSHPGVKVLTMHAAKGLQFPVVAVVGVEAGKLPLSPAHGVDAIEHDAQQRRLFFVACSRAMRRLIVLANRYRPSQYIAGLSDAHWEIEDL